MRIKCLTNYAFVVMFAISAFVYARSNDNKGADSKVEKVAEDTTIYVQPDLQPQYPGGYTALWNFINKNLTWPNPDADVDGKVVVQFVVEKDGTLTHKTIVRELEPAFDKEALRIINLLPKWIPAKLNGKPVRSYYKVPITFRLE